MTYSNKTREQLKLLIIAILIFICSFLTIYFHLYIRTGTVFTHFYYIPIILAALWYRRKGIAVAIFLAVFLILSHNFVRGGVTTINDYLRAFMLIGIAFIVATLRERIMKV